MEGGSLDHVLHEKKKKLSLTKKKSILLDIVKAVQYLHNLSPPILHRDLKSSNVLVSFSLTY